MPVLVEIGVSMSDGLSASVAFAEVVSIVSSSSVVEVIVSSIVVRDSVVA